jgi:Zn-dependent peptidase ImmA (M78 family)/DNA-binding XRE family transcriptional regulator
MRQTFKGAAMRLARLFADQSLDDVASAVDKTRQYLHKIETGQAVPTAQLQVELATALRVEPDFFYAAPAGSLGEEQIHFRKLFTTRVGIKAVAMARAEFTGMLVAALERRVKFPEVRIPTIADVVNSEEVERAAEQCRREWELGLGPIADMTRLAELVGAVVTSFPSMSSEIDAMSFAVGRPIIVRNESKQSACRQRFDIAHELAHASLHSGRVTGDHETESQAHRFACALLVPRSMMLKLFPSSRGQRLDWIGLAEFKRTWGISKAALLYRARLLGLLTDQQYKSGVIHLKKTGQTAGEKEDDSIPLEEPTLLKRTFELLATKKGVYSADVAREMSVTEDLIEDIVGFSLPRPSPVKPVARPKLRLVA